MGVPAINVYATPISTVMCYFVIMVFNFAFLRKITKHLPSLGKTFLKPLISGAACALAALFSYRLYDMIIQGHIFSSARLATVASTGLAIITGGIAYLIVLFALRTLHREDVMLMPKGEKICKLLDRYRLIKE